VSAHDHEFNLHPEFMLFHGVDITQGSTVIKRGSRHPRFVPNPAIESKTPQKVQPWPLSWASPEWFSVSSLVLEVS